MNLDLLVNKLKTWEPTRYLCLVLFLLSFIFQLVNTAFLTGIAAALSNVLASTVQFALIILACLSIYRDQSILREMTQWQFVRHTLHYYSPAIALFLGAWLGYFVGKIL